MGKTCKSFRGINEYNSNFINSFDFRLFDWLFGARDKETKIDQASENIKDKGLLKKIGNIFKKKEKDTKDN